MEAGIIKTRLIDAATFAAASRPSHAPGVFSIKVEIIGILITYIFTSGRGAHARDQVVTWRALAQGTSNPLVVAMTGLLAAAKNHSP